MDWGLPRDHGEDKKNAEIWMMTWGAAGGLYMNVDPLVEVTVF